jgi:hypothetical protein
MASTDVVIASAVSANGTDRTKVDLDTVLIDRLN